VEEKAVGEEAAAAGRKLVMRGGIVVEHVDKDHALGAELNRPEMEFSEAARCCLAPS